jgi:hypothetical protein
MFILQRRSAFRVIGLIALIAIIAGCAPAPAAPGGTSATPVPPTAATPGGNPQPAAASALLDGTWDGTLNVAGQVIAIKLNFKGQAGTIDIPAQGARDLRMENFVAQGNELKFEMLPKPSTATFEGKVEGDTISGSYEQSGYKGTFSATRQAAAEAPAPAAKPYKEEEVTFKNGQYTLAGTLSLPEDAGPHPAVVLISGSGPQNRDEELFGFKPFAILADALTRQGIAVLRYDDRGIGGSSTGTEADTSETYAADVSAAYDYLKTRSEIDPKKIG